MIRNYNLRMECLHRIRCFVGRHGVGQIHADERHVDILQGAHFWDAFRVTGEVKTHAAVSEHVSVSASLVMEEFAWGGPPGQVKVIGGDCLDGPALPRFGFTIRNWLGRRDRCHYGGRRQDVRSGLADLGDGSGIHVVGVNVGNQNEVRFWRPDKLRRFRWVEVNGFSSRLDQRAGVIQRSDLDVSCRRWKYLWSGRRVG